MLRKLNRRHLDHLSRAPQHAADKPPPPLNDLEGAVARASLDGALSKDEETLRTLGHEPVLIWHHSRCDPPELDRRDLTAEEDIPDWADVVAPPGCRPVGRQMREIRRFDGDAREVVSRWAAGGEAPATVNGPGGGGGRGGRKGRARARGARGGNNGAAGRGGANAKVHEGGAETRESRLGCAATAPKPPGAADEKQPPDGNGNGTRTARKPRKRRPRPAARPRIRRGGRSASAVPAPGGSGGGPRRGGRGGGRSAAVASRGIGASFGSAGRSKALPPRGWGAVAATLRAFA